MAAQNPAGYTLEIMEHDHRKRLSCHCHYEGDLLIAITANTSHAAYLHRVHHLLNAHRAGNPSPTRRVRRKADEKFKAEDLFERCDGEPERASWSARPRHRTPRTESSSTTPSHAVLAATRADLRSPVSVV